GDRVMSSLLSYRFQCKCSPQSTLLVEPMFLDVREHRLRNEITNRPALTAHGANLLGGNFEQRRVDDVNPVRIALDGRGKLVPGPAVYDELDPFEDLVRSVPRIERGHRVSAEQE